MTLRERIANWLTKGRYSELQHDLMLAKSNTRILTSQKYKLQHDLNAMKMRLSVTDTDLARKQKALEAIAACETSGANATVRKMALLAKVEVISTIPVFQQ